MAQTVPVAALSEQMHIGGDLRFFQRRIIKQAVFNVNRIVFSLKKESRWRVSVKGLGTYVLGASLMPRTLRLPGKQFNDYLREEGLERIVAARTQEGVASDSSHERYAKHVKALVRVMSDMPVSFPGDTAYRRVLGYPAEIVPLDDPYHTSVGDVVRFRALLDGQPLGNQPVLVGGRTTDDRAVGERKLITDANGLVRVRLDRRGTWYVKFIDMRRVPASARDSVNYESKWATLTFARL